MIAAAPIALCGGGCARERGFAYNGTWVGHRKLDPAPGTDPHVVDEVSRLTLTIASGTRFKMVDAGMPKEGDYRVEGDHAVLSVDTILGKPMSRQDPDVQRRNVPITLTPVGAKLKLVDPGGFDRDGLTLERITPASTPG